jgi:adenine-specific DNA-methyltransferase
VAKERTTRKKTVESLKHESDKRRNIPTAEYESVVKPEDKKPRKLRYPRNTDLDPQLVWRGKDEQDWSDLVVHAPPLYIQEKVQPKVLIDDLLRQTKESREDGIPHQTDLFADFDEGVPEGAETDFYQHDQNWSNRMILGDSLQVMASLAEREGLRGKVQCIYIDPPYGIKFNSNFQWSTTSRDVNDGKAEHITREPEQVKAFRDTWRDGIHSYLTYLRDRLSVARDLLSDTGSIFVQIGDENVHRARALMEEVFGEENFVSQITVRKTTSEGSTLLGATTDYLLWFARNRELAKSHTIYSARSPESEGRYSSQYLDGSLFRFDTLTSSRPAGEGDVKEFTWFGKTFTPGKGTFKTTETGLRRLGKADRLLLTKTGKLNYRRARKDFGYGALGNLWSDISGAVQSRSDPKVYVVQSSISLVTRCLLLASDPGDLVLDPTSGSGTTAMAAEQLGRRWIAVDTSRVALALARARIMGARYPYYILADSKAGQETEARITGMAPSSEGVRGDIRHGFVYERVPRITLGAIANNAQIDVVWEEWQEKLGPLRASLNKELDTSWEEWEIPREAEESWPDTAKQVHADWWDARIARQKQIDDVIASKAESEYLYDRPYVDNKKVRVAGPFTVESLSPHRELGVDENEELIDPLSRAGEDPDKPNFTTVILENMKTAGVQQAHKEDRITFSSLTPWPGDLVCAEGRYLEGDDERRAAIFIGPEFGTVQRADLVQAAREAADASFDALIACAFNYEAHTTEFSSLGKLPVLKARMNADLHMAEDLKQTDKANLFVIFGEPDIDILNEADGKLRVKVNGVDVFKPQTGEVVSDGADGIACWFIDTDYNEESFFVRHAYFLGANDPYKGLKTSLKAEIDEDAWESLHSDTSRPFDRPSSGRIAVKVINHLGDEVMKVFRV